MGSKDNTLCYIEFPATDLEATKAFYVKVFGWTFHDFGPDYAAFEDGHMAGGFTRDNPGPGVAPLAVIFHKDLEAAYKRVVDGGGRIILEIFSYPGGRRFHFADPSGNVLAVCTDVE
jgi:hypothetical protein